MFLRIIFLILLTMCGFITFQFFQIRADFFKVYTVPAPYEVTAQDATLTLVDFSNLNCDRCKALHPILMDAIKRDGKIRYIPRPVSFDNDQNKRAITAVYAAAAQGKFLEMMDKLYERAPVTDDESLFKAAQDIGLDTQKLSRDMNDPDIRARADENDMFFKKWRLSETPTLLIGTESIYIPRDETPTAEALIEKFNAVRSWF